MNVDILEKKTSWWWYLIFAVLTMSLTLTVWIIFKKSLDVRITFFDTFLNNLCR